MTEYIIKSTISLTVLYVLYFFLLRNTRSFVFNRFYLLFAVLFSLTAPLVHIPTAFPAISHDVRHYVSSISSVDIKGTVVDSREESIINLIDLSATIYFLVSAVLLTRFIINIRKIVFLISDSDKVAASDPGIVLAKNQALPYSFFRNIIVNKAEYEKGHIDNKLILHEQAHCDQLHSIDILFIELVKTFLWFNPVIWLLKREIQLNHEYLADNSVLQTQNLKSYQDILLNLVSRNNSTYLASNFNYSLTKKRLIMMTKNSSSTNLMVRKIVIAPVVLLLAVTLTCCREELSENSSMSFGNEWWYPILEKHNIELQAFNNFGDLFEMGSSISIDNRIVTLENALFIIKTDSDVYTLITSPLAYHDLDSNIISGESATVSYYNYQKDANLTYYHEIHNFKFKSEGNTASYEADWKYVHTGGNPVSKEQDRSFQKD